MLHTLSIEDIEARVWDKFFSDNPQLKRGEKMYGPVAFCADGKPFSPSIHEELTDEQRKCVVSVSSWKVGYDADGNLPNMAIQVKSGWVYPFQVLYFDWQREALSKNIGDEVTVMDVDTLLPKKVPLTQELVDTWRFVMVRAGIVEEPVAG